MGRGAAKDAQKQSDAQIAQQTANENTDRAKTDQAVTDYRSAIMDNIFKSNPWMDPTYQANLKATAGANATGTQNAARANANDIALRTGSNTASFIPMLAATQRASQTQANNDLLKIQTDAVDKYQQEKNFGLEELARIPQLYAGMYGTDVSGVKGGNELLSSAVQAPDFSSTLIGGISNMAAGAAVGAGTAVCWIADAVFGTNTVRARIVRHWMNRIYGRTMFERVVLWIYQRTGVRLAELSRKYAFMHLCFRWLFNRLLDRACKEIAEAYGG